MKKAIFFALLSSGFLSAQKATLTPDIAKKLANLPIHCINQEYPNKTAHLINSAEEARMTPSELHPSFYGCFDWHSSVHGHWMLSRLLNKFPEGTLSTDIEKILDNSLQITKLSAEAEYFKKYNGAKTFERTYGWAWLLKLDEELSVSHHLKAKIWRQNLQPLLHVVIDLWKNYLAKQDYPNRTGIHPNTAFALGFAIDWARKNGDKDFEQKISETAKRFYLDNTNTPAYLEPDSSDFFSPSLEIADLMRRILPQKEFVQWLDKFYEKRSIDNITTIPKVSDINDYQTVHLVGLSFSRSWCMRGIAGALPNNHPLKKVFTEKSDILLQNALPLIFQGNYGGDHWLATFAVYALDTKP